MSGALNSQPDDMPHRVHIPVPSQRQRAAARATGAVNAVRRAGTAAASAASSAASSARGRNREMEFDDTPAYVPRVRTRSSVPSMTSRPYATTSPAAASYPEFPARSPGMTPGHKRTPPPIPPRLPRSALASNPASTSSVPTTGGAGMSSYLGNPAGFASKARSVLSTAASLASATASTVVSAASGTDHRGWDEWARDWREGRKAAIKGKETIYVLPGWAVKRPREGEEDAFDLHVSVMGFANFERELESVSRTQRALMGMAKRFAALPALPVTPSPAPVEPGGKADVLDELAESPVDDKPLISFDDVPSAGGKDPLGAAKDILSSAHVRRPSDPSSSTTRLAPGTPPKRRETTETAFEDPAALTLAHAYLDMRLRPFWSSVLPFRRVALTLYPIELGRDAPPPVPTEELVETEPLVRTTFTTNAQGHFHHNVVIPWERIATHPGSVEMAFADDPQGDHRHWGLVVRAVLLSEDGPDKIRQATGSDDAIVRAPDGKRFPRRVAGATSFFSSAEVPNQNDGDGDEEMGLMGLGKSNVESTTVVDVSRPGGVRVISDLDDTVKHSDILGGPREVFRNVFCRRLDDICVPGMNKLYCDLHDHGMSGLHFVSNSPFELFPIISSFLKLHEFPSFYSLKLKFYGGRSLLTSLIEPAGERKRPSVLEIMDEFYDSKFLLFGDSGEQDLELYSAIAHERPHQVAAIFIRDVTSGRLDEFRSLTASTSKLGLDDAGGSSPSPTSATTTPTGPRFSDTPPPGSGASTPTGSTFTADEMHRRTVQELQDLSAAEQKILKRAADWEERVARALDATPPSVRLVFFQEADEIESLARALVEGKLD